MRIVLHVDMDAFFAAVEERDKLRLRGRPIVVGSDPKAGKGRGVVSTANYAARKYGIHSALPITKAWQLSQQAKKAGKPEVVFMGVDMAKYARVSANIMQYLESLVTSGEWQGGAFEQASVDEAYLEFPISNFQLSNNDEMWQWAAEKAGEIKAHIKHEFGLTASIGVGPNKLIAKIASDRQKPDGLTVVPEEAVQDFLDPLPVRVIPGIGPKAEAQLMSLGVKRVGELRGMPKEKLLAEFGKHGEGMYRQARGISDSVVAPGGPAKSIGLHRTFGKDTLDSVVLMSELKDMAAEIGADVARDGRLYRTVVLTVRFSNFKTQTRSHTLEAPDKDVKTLETEGLKLLMPFLDSRENPGRQKIRLIGLRVEKFVAHGNEEKGSMKKEKGNAQQGLF
ncbi:MAG: DNA polymerase IV [Candidatus Harrisonbacteria bacterium CG10_big_fil_rev_8_21_14_0_10_49_15]|uniref:DNA polymerase IV n=1 Tax=Candidatus Harrisonbacteria bacterium CG10_big_fil_rev_8_21_14_0_10_49_15 TaxID=1974587 RepID=A0A2H0UMY4_9BACT|nr:MAG: DNA polymerase IV [Candidatus Harrisonbacteria bacterium CG10_big_fil_rev_8_21_14_0_10_49_15]